MYSQDVVGQSEGLQQTVNVKRLRFKDTGDITNISKVAQVGMQEKNIYKACGDRTPISSVGKGSYPPHKAKSESTYRYSSVRKAPQNVQTITLELPLHYGADRAVQVIENKIKPKKATRAPSVSRAVITEHNISEELRTSMNKTIKFKTIIEKLNTIEEVADLEEEPTVNEDDEHLNKIQKQIRNRRERIQKALPKSTAVVKSTKRKLAKSKILNAIASINDKLQKMQEKYGDMPRVQYKNINDSCIQSENLEILYENINYPEGTKMGDADIKNDLQKVSDKILGDSKMQERIKEMNEMFPEFPKIEDTLIEIENHLDNMVSLKKGKSGDQKQTGKFSDDKYGEVAKAWNEVNLTDVLDSLENDRALQDSDVDEIVKKQQDAQKQKLRSIRQQIDEVEGFCDRLSEVANYESVDGENILNVIAEERTYQEDLIQAPNKSSAVTDFIEGPDLQSSIKKSNYLSKEFGNFNGHNSQPMVKIFSDNRRFTWKDRMREYKQTNHEYSVESVTKMIDKLQFTLENSIYKPVV